MLFEEILPFIRKGAKARRRTASTGTGDISLCPYRNILIEGPDRWGNVPDDDEYWPCSTDILADDWEVI